MENIDVESWVKKAEGNQVAFREAVHTLFIAIGNSDFLSGAMSVKGGILLAIRYHGNRYTMDADFSTHMMYSAFDESKFFAVLKQQLINAVESLDYNLDCRIQSHEVKPKGDNKNFQALKIVIGYAYKGGKNHTSLINGNCTRVLKIDYSFNERNCWNDTIFIGGKKIIAYSLPDLIAEKYRAIIQQKTRNRSRRQDPYDIHFLMIRGVMKEADLRKRILKSLKLKAESRGLKIDKRSLADKDIIKRSSTDYNQLENEINGPLPPFEEVYGRIRLYYESLPWEDFDLL